MHGRRSFPFFGGRITPTRKVIRKATSVKDLRILSEKVTLDKVFGLTTLNSNGLACNPVTGILAYPAGCVIVLLDPYTNTQSHIFNPEKKTLTALAFSSDGKYLASGECGHNPCVRIWELGDNPTKVAELKGHKYAINCVAFSPNLKYLASIGDQHDMNVNIWNWKNGSKAACNKIGSKVRSVHFSENGNYLVTVGNRHVKYWYFDTEASSKLNMPTPLQGRSGILGDQKNNYFCDVACGVGKNANNTYCITKSGKLCAFSAKRLLDRWVELRCTGANCLAANEEHIFCGCSNGIIRVFDPTTLKFICTLPKPHSLGVDIAKGLDASHMMPKNANERYPDVLAMVLDSQGKKLTCIYNDHSMYIWDVKDVKKVGKSASYLYHSGCIWGVETYPVLEDDQNPRIPLGSFLTCSSDDTIRVWNIEDGAPANKTFPRNIYSKDSLKIVYTDEELANIQDMSGFIPGAESKTGVRCLKVSPDGQLLAAGDRSGNLRVYDLQFIDELIKIVAHDSEILCVEFSPPESGYKLLATSSRDRLIHIFDINQDFALLQTIDDHSSSITAVRFNYDNETFQLLSCGADKNIMFHNAQTNNNGAVHFVRNTIVVGKATMYDMDIEPTRKFAATVGVDRNVRIYDIQGAKQTQCYKGSLSDDGTVIKIQLDPSGLYAATSCSDKSVCVYEFESGDCNAVMYGHSELVLGLQFTVDGSRLLSVSGDGCIFIWKLPSSFRQAIISRLQELNKPIPQCCQVDTDPFSSIRRTTFQVPKNKEEVFEEGSASLFDEPGTAEGPIDYRFSVGRLPAWAKKQIIGEEETTQPIVKEFQAPTLPAGRWGQRIGNSRSGMAAHLDQPSFSYSNTTDETFSLRETTQLNESVHEHKQESLEHQVIYPPANQDDFDEEVASSFEVTANNLPQSPCTSDVCPSPTVRKADTTWKKTPVLLAEHAPDDVETSDGEAEPTESDGEVAVSDDDNESPLKHHFECLASDGKIVDESEPAEGPVQTEEELKLANDLMSYRASISAKFLSRSQQMRLGDKTPLNAEEQRHLLESIAKSMNTNPEDLKLDLAAKENGAIGEQSIRTDSLEQEYQSIEKTITLDSQEANLEGDVIVEEMLLTHNAESSPAEQQKSTSDLIALFNQRSSTPAYAEEKKQRSRIQQESRSATATPGLSPVGSPKRRHPNSPDKVVTFDLGSKGRTLQSNSGTPKPPVVVISGKTSSKEKDKGVRMRRAVRPTLNKGPRPKSLILPQPVVFEMEKDTSLKSLSDTELEEKDEDDFPVSLKRNKRKLAKNATPTQNPNKTFVTQLEGKRVQREIAIDDKVTIESQAGDKGRYAPVRQSSIDTEKPVVTENGHPSSPSIELLLSHSQTKPFSETNELYLYEQAHSNVYYNSSPPERDMGPDSLSDIREAHFEENCYDPAANPQSYEPVNGETESPTGSKATFENEEEIEEEMEVSVDKCNAVIADLMNSFKQVSIFHNTVMSMPSSSLQQQVLNMLSASFSAIEAQINNLRERSKDLCDPDTKSLVMSSDFNNILTSIEHLKSTDMVHSSKDGLSHGDGTDEKSVLNLLQTYSSVLVSLVTQKLEREQQLEAD